MTDTRFLPDFTNTLEWNLIARQSYQAQPATPTGYLPLPARSFTIDGSYTVMVGVRSVSAERRWWLGCWAEQRLLFSPSSTSDFTAFVKTKQFGCQLGSLTLCTFPKLQSPWILYLRFPWWLEDAMVEIWRYDGRDQTVFDAIATP